MKFTPHAMLAGEGGAALARNQEARGDCQFDMRLRSPCDFEFNYLPIAPTHGLVGCAGPPDTNGQPKRTAVK